MLGLIGAALGVRRDEEERLQALANSYRIGIRLDAPGVLLRDFHTADVPESGTGRNRREYRTRREEILAVKEQRANPIVSTRDYRCDACATIVVEALPGAPHSSASSRRRSRPRSSSSVWAVARARRACPSNRS